MIESGSVSTAGKITVDRSTVDKIAVGKIAIDELTVDGGYGPDAGAAGGAEHGDIVIARELRPSYGRPGGELWSAPVECETIGRGHAADISVSAANIPVMKSLFGLCSLYWLPALVTA